DHLCEAAAADPARDRREAERRAVAAFGAAHVLAAQFAVVSLARRTRQTGCAVVLATAGVLATMRLRLAWYAALQWTMSEEAKAVGAMVLLIDRCAFVLALAANLGAVAYLSGRRIPAVPDAGYCEQLRR